MWLRPDTLAWNKRNERLKHLQQKCKNDKRIRNRGSAIEWEIKFDRHCEKENKPPSQCIPKMNCHVLKPIICAGCNQYLLVKLLAYFF